MRKQMTLGDIISVLERKDPERPIRLDFVHFQPCGVHSYRGYYDQFAIGYTTEGDAKVGELLATLQGAVGEELYGYKGGKYTMHADTPVWIANHNEAGGTAVVDVEDQGWCIRLVTACID